MVRYSRKGFVFIDQPVKEDECGAKFNSGTWDPKLGACFRLFHATGGDEVAPINDDVADKLWKDPYNLDKMEVYRNAYDCWVNNNQKAANAVYTEDLEEGSVPECFFSMPVVWGHYKTPGFHQSEGHIYESEWEGQEKGKKWKPKRYYKGL